MQEINLPLKGVLPAIKELRSNHTNRRDNLIIRDRKSKAEKPI